MEVFSPRLEFLSNIRGNLMQDILQYLNTRLSTLQLLSIQALLSVMYWGKLQMLLLEGLISLSVVWRTKVSDTRLKPFLGQVGLSNLQVWSAVTNHIWAKPVKDRKSTRLNSSHGSISYA